MNVFMNDRALGEFQFVDDFQAFRLVEVLPRHGGDLWIGHIRSHQLYQRNHVAAFTDRAFRYNYLQLYHIIYVSRN